jgi:hypothetical protein
VASTLVLLALPMLASSNPCVSQLAGPSARLLIPSLRRRAGVVRRPGYRALC